MTTTLGVGRLGNQLIRNLAVSLIAEKHDLYVDYVNFDLIQLLGISLFVGKNKYNNTIQLNDDNYFDILNQNELYSNIDSNHNFFQTNRIIAVLYSYLHNEKIKTNIMNKNPYNHRYNNNNDIFIHIRLTDAAQYNPGLEYYMNAINTINNRTNGNIENIYISSDDIHHEIIQQLMNKHKNVILINYNEIETIQFGSTCKNIILSHGSFSAMIGYLSFFSNIFYPKYGLLNTRWYGDMFSIHGWNEVIY
jgi:hypothetical protein